MTDLTVSPHNAPCGQIKGEDVIRGLRYGELLRKQAKLAGMGSAMAGWSAGDAAASGALDELRWFSQQTQHGSELVHHCLYGQDRLNSTPLHYAAARGKRCYRHN